MNREIRIKRQWDGSGERSKKASYYETQREEQERLYGEEGKGI